MENEIKQLMKDIVMCEELDDLKSECNEITALQREENEWQVPEPWNGDISKAPVLFLCLNPSINKKELYPLRNSDEWTEDRIIDFFTNRFSNNNGEWVKNGVRPKKKNGEYVEPKKWVRNWVFIKSWYCQLTAKSKQDVKIGEEYMISDIVHCKSLKGKGVDDTTLKKCSELYLKRLLLVSKAKIIIILGSKAKESIEEELFKGQKQLMFTLVPLYIEKRLFHFLFMYHTNYRKKGMPRSPSNLIKKGLMKNKTVQQIRALIQ